MTDSFDTLIRTATWLDSRGQEKAASLIMNRLELDLPCSLEDAKLDISVKGHFFAQNPSVYIWSDEHRAFWRPNGSGYTSNPLDAGVYTFREAYEKTAHCGPEKKIMFYPVDCAPDSEMPDPVWSGWKS